MGNFSHFLMPKPEKRFIYLAFVYLFWSLIGFGFYFNHEWKRQPCYLNFCIFHIYACNYLELTGLKSCLLLTSTLHSFFSVMKLSTVDHKLQL